MIKVFPVWGKIYYFNTQDNVCSTQSFIFYFCSYCSRHFVWSTMIIHKLTFATLYNTIQTKSSDFINTAPAATIILLHVYSCIICLLETDHMQPFNTFRVCYIQLISNMFYKFCCYNIYLYNFCPTEKVDEQNLLISMSTCHVAQT